MRAFAITLILSALGAFAPNAGAAPARDAVAVGKSAYGSVLFDGRGFALYVFTHDRAGRSTCSGARRCGSQALAGRHRAPRRRVPAGYLRRQAALLLRRRPQARPDPVSERVRVRRPLAGRARRRRAGSLTITGAAEDALGWEATSWLAAQRRARRRVRRGRARERDPTRAAPCPAGTARAGRRPACSAATLEKAARATTWPMIPLDAALCARHSRARWSE
jgi:hypothetical protein